MAVPWWPPGTCPFWSLIGWFWSRDLNTNLWLALGTWSRPPTACSTTRTPSSLSPNLRYKYYFFIRGMYVVLVFQSTRIDLLYSRLPPFNLKKYPLFLFLQGQCEDWGSWPRRHRGDQHCREDNLCVQHLQPRELRPRRWQPRVMLTSYWSILITWPEYWHLIGPYIQQWHHGAGARRGSGHQHIRARLPRPGKTDLKLAN